MMTLFDLSEFGGPEPERRAKRRAAPDEIRLRPPWVLLSGARHGPIAHLLPDKAMPNKDRAWPTRCGNLGYRVTVDGSPMARCCGTCWRIHEKLA